MVDACVAPAVAALLLAAVWGNTAAAVHLPEPEALDAVLDGYVDAGHYPFLYLRLENSDGSVAYEHGAVNRELLPDAGIDGQTWMRIWSMSKPVTIVVVLDLIEEGVLSLDDPVADYIPEFADLKVAMTADGREVGALAGEELEAACPFNPAPTSAAMTVRYLINHTSGLHYSLAAQCIEDLVVELNVFAATDSKDFIDRVATLPLLHQPGTTYRYGISTTILGMVAERASGKSLKQLVEERLTGPLGIDGLRYGLPEDQALLPMFSGRDGAIRLAEPRELGAYRTDPPDYSPSSELYLGGLGMIGTADGYADFARLLLNYGELNGHHVLDRATVEEMTAPHTQLDSPDGHNGYNIWVAGEGIRERGEGDEGIWIGGGFELTHYWIDPMRDFVGVIMTQMYWLQEGGIGMHETIRAEVYRQLWAEEGQ